MTTTTLTLNTAIDEAFKLATPAQQRRFKRRCERPGYREEFAAEIRDNIVDDPRTQSFGMAFVAMGQESFTADTPFSIDTNKLREFLDLILEYAPKLIDLILKLIPLFMSLLLVVVFSGSAVAQDCPGDRCPLRTAISQTVARQWYNKDGLTTRQHAEHYHRTNTAGMTEAEIIASNDHDHNTWGSGYHYPERSNVQTVWVDQFKHSGTHTVSSSVVSGDALVLDSGQVLSCEVPAGRATSYVDSSGIVYSDIVYSETQRDLVYESHSNPVWMASGGADQHRHPLRSAVGIVRNRGRMAVEAVRSSRPIAPLLGATRQAARNFVSALRPRNIRAAIRSQSCR